MGKLERNYLDGEMLSKLADTYAKIEAEMLAEEYCSQLHEPRHLVITKVSGNNNNRYGEGHLESGMCKGIEVGKAVLLTSSSRWFRTSVVTSVSDDTFTTMNSTYKYNWTDEDRNNN